MSSKRKNFLISFLKYSFSLAVAIFLFWWVYGDMDFEVLFGRFKEIKFDLLLWSVLFGIIGYIVRAFRWNIILEPLGYDLKTIRTFLAVMIGYFANLLVPRLGEVTRCAALKRTDNVEMTSSFGSVVAERAVDMITLLLVITAGFIIEFDKLFKILGGEVFTRLENINTKLSLVIILVVSIILFFFIFKFLLKRFKGKLARNTFYLKIRAIIREVLDGLFAIGRLKRPVQFWTATVLIWILYFFMTYIVFFAFGPTSDLGVSAGILVLIMGGLGMATPVQGGVGSFHLFVSGALLLYGVAEEDGKFFAFVIHTSQFLTIIILGGISLIVSFFVNKRDSKNVNSTENSR